MDNILIYIGLLLSLALPFIVYWIIPTYVPADKQEQVKDVVVLSYSGILFFINVLSIDRYSTGISGIVIVAFTFVIITLVASGTFWWIPTYVRADQQKLARQWLIISASVATVLFSFINRRLSSIYSGSETIIQDIPLFKHGGKRRK